MNENVITVNTVEPTRLGLPTRYLVGGGGGVPWTCKINKTGENLINFSNSWTDIEACGHKFYILCERKFSY